MTDESGEVDLFAPAPSVRYREIVEAFLPGVLADGVVDASRLGELVDAPVAVTTDARERYGLMWAGKADAVRSLQTPTSATLLPDHQRSIGWDSAQNLFVEGDNLEVLKLFQKAYNDRVKLIYIDPPYNTGSDLIYEDDFSDGLRAYLAYTGQLDSEGRRVSTNSDAVGGRRHSRWLSMMYPRLVLARNLLTQDGAIFISIDDHEVESLTHLCNEVFGPENFVAKFPRVTKRAGKSSDLVAANHDYVLAYRRSSAAILNRFAHTDEGFRYEDEFVAVRGPYKLNQTLDYGSIQYSASLDYEIEIEGQVLRPGGATAEEMARRQKRNPKTDWCWRWSRRLYDFGRANGFVVLKEGRDGPRIYTKTYANATIKEVAGSYQVVIQERTKTTTSLDFTDNRYSNDNAKKSLVGILEAAAFDYTKPVDLIETVAALITTPGGDDIVMDFFAGSGTTGHAIARLNASDGGSRRCISVNLPEPTPEGSVSREGGFLTVSDVTYGRLSAVMDTYETARAEGLRVARLGRSNFVGRDSGSFGDLVLRVSTLASDNVDWDSVATEVLLKEGISLDAPWERRLAGGAEVIVAAGVAVALTKDVTSDVVAGVLEMGPRVAVFLEDGFAGHDAVKTNAHTNAKQLGIKMKTV